VRLLHRLSAVLLSLGLMAGNIAVCAGWAATPEERMACCADGPECPMHKRQAHDSHHARLLTQAEADSCCASSEGEASSPSPRSFAAAMSLAALGSGVALPPSVPTLFVSDGWRVTAPVPIATIPRHVLLSVFLV